MAIIYSGYSASLGASHARVRECCAAHLFIIIIKCSIISSRISSSIIIIDGNINIPRPTCRFAGRRLRAVEGAPWTLSPRKIGGRSWSRLAKIHD